MISPFHPSWGTSQGERAMTFPGDAIVPEPITSYTLGITIHATPSAVWPWLVQMGQGRGGFYTYEWIENVLGADIRNADRVIPELQHLGVNDRILLTPDPYFGRPGQFMTVALVQPERVLVLRQTLPNGSPATWTFLLEPRPDGSTRLLTRRRSGPPTLFDRVMLPGYVVMDKRMLRGIRERAERLSQQSALTGSLFASIADRAQFRDLIAVRVVAPPPVIFRALHEITLSDMRVAWLLGELRYLPLRFSLNRRTVDHHRPFLSVLFEGGTIVLVDNEPLELITASAGRLHRILDQTPVRFESREAFLRFNEPGYEKLFMSIRVVPADRTGCHWLLLEHATLALSADAERRFRRYWRVIKPAGAFVTRQLLNAVRLRAECDHAAQRDAA